MISLRWLYSHAIYLPFSLSSFPQILLLVGAGLDTPGRRGRTALFHACAGGYFALAERLVAAGARIDIPDTAGATVLEVESELVAQAQAAARAEFEEQHYREARAARAQPQPQPQPQAPTQAQGRARGAVAAAAGDAGGDDSSSPLPPPSADAVTRVTNSAATAVRGRVAGALQRGFDRRMRDVVAAVVARGEIARVDGEARAATAAAAAAAAAAATAAAAAAAAAASSPEHLAGLPVKAQKPF
jgi:hypothetical protein